MLRPDNMPGGSRRVQMLRPDNMPGGSRRVQMLRPDNMQEAVGKYKC